MAYYFGKPTGNILPIDFGGLDKLSPCPPGQHRDTATGKCVADAVKAPAATTPGLATGASTTPSLFPVTKPATPFEQTLMQYAQIPGAAASPAPAAPVRVAGGGSGTEDPIECQRRCQDEFENDPNPQHLQDCLDGCYDTVDPGQDCKAKCWQENPLNKAERDACLAKCPKHTCAQDNECLPDQRCVNGECVAKDTIIEPGCGKGPVTWSDGSKVEVEGCPCTAAYYPEVPGQCRAGYHAVGEGADARCECDNYHPKEEPAGLGEFTWPPELQAYMSRLLGKGNSFMDMQYGFTPEVLNAMFGKNFGDLRDLEAVTRRGTLDTLAGQNLLGTPTALGAMNRMAWDSENNVANIIRDIMLANEEQKRKDMTQYTGLASDIFGIGKDFSQTGEILNSARRGEGREWMALLLKLLETFAAKQ